MNNPILLLFNEAFMLVILTCLFLLGCIILLDPLVKKEIVKEQKLILSLLKKGNLSTKEISILMRRYFILDMNLTFLQNNPALKRWFGLLDDFLKFDKN